MKLKLPGKKKILIITLAFVLIGGILFTSLMPKKENESDTRQREYIVKTDTITVGIQANGTITSEKEAQFVSGGVKLERYTVKKGDYVKKGDVIAHLSKDDIDEKLNAALSELKTQEFSLKKAKADKENFKAEADKKISDLKAPTENAYNEKAAALNAKIKSGQSLIAQKSNELINAENEIKALLNEQAQGAITLAELKRQINVINEEIKAILAQITELSVDTVANADAIAALTAQKTEKETELSNLTLKKQELAVKDYAVLIKALQESIKTISELKASLEKELATDNALLSAAQEQRNRELESEKATIALLNKQTESQAAMHENALRLAALEREKAAKAYDELLALSKNAQVTAMADGVILAIDYAQNAVTSSTSPIAEIGTSKDMYLMLFVDPVDIVDVSEGQQVSFYTDAFPDKTYYGTVTKKGYLQNDSGKFAVTVKYDDTELLNGMETSATLIIKEKKDILTLQNKAIFIENNKQYVNVRLADGALEKREVKTGFSDGRLTEIISGLSDGDTVITEERYEDS